MCVYVHMVVLCVPSLSVGREGWCLCVAVGLLSCVHTCLWISVCINVSV